MLIYSKSKIHSRECGESSSFVVAWFLRSIACFLQLNHINPSFSCSQMKSCCCKQSMLSLQQPLALTCLSQAVFCFVLISAIDCMLFATKPYQSIFLMFPKWRAVVARQSIEKIPCPGCTLSPSSLICCDLIPAIGCREARYVESPVTLTICSQVGHPLSPKLYFVVTWFQQSIPCFLLPHTSLWYQSIFSNVCKLWLPKNWKVNKSFQDWSENA